MMRVILEIVPRGDESKKFTAGVLEIANDRTGDAATGNYDLDISGPVQDGDQAINNEH